MKVTATTLLVAALMGFATGCVEKDEAAAAATRTTHAAPKEKAPAQSAAKPKPTPPVVTELPPFVEGTKGPAETPDAEMEQTVEKIEPPLPTKPGRGAASIQDIKTLIAGLESRLGAKLTELLKKHVEELVEEIESLKSSLIRMEADHNAFRKDVLERLAESDRRIDELEAALKKKTGEGKGKAETPRVGEGARAKEELDEVIADLRQELKRLKENAEQPNKPKIVETKKVGLYALATITPPCGGPSFEAQLPLDGSSVSFRCRHGNTFTARWPAPPKE